MSHNLNILIVEDELITADDMKRKLHKIGYNVVGIGSSFDEGMKIAENHDLDLAILDINIQGKKDGIELAKAFQEHFDFPIIFLTSYSNPSIVARASKVNPIAYLNKPFAESDLYTAIEIGINNFERMQLSSPNLYVVDALFVRTEHVYRKIQFDQIKWLKGAQNYTEIHTTDGMQLVRSLLKDLMLKLPVQKFCRTHRSYIVNTQFIEAIKPNSLNIGNDEIPIQREVREELLSKLKTLN